MMMIIFEDFQYLKLESVKSRSLVAFFRIFSILGTKWWNRGGGVAWIEVGSKLDPLCKMEQFLKA